jgi:hypothetical protein
MKNSQIEGFLEEEGIVGGLRPPKVLKNMI